MSPERLRALTPMARTSAGREASAVLTAFWTFTMAMSSLTPVLKVMVHMYSPLLVQLEEK